MTLASLPKMFSSETEGWPDIVRTHPSVNRLMSFFVMPMSLIPPLMYAYAQAAHPGAVTPQVEPPLSAGELLAVGFTFFLVEIATVALMAVYIQMLGDRAQVRPAYTEAYTLAAIAPTPLWLASLALFVPSVAFNVAVVALAWLGSVALIRHGVRPLIGVHDEVKARRLANAITLAGVGVWIALMAVLMMLMGMLVGWR